MKIGIPLTYEVKNENIILSKVLQDALMIGLYDTDDNGICYFDAISPASSVRRYGLITFLKKENVAGLLVQNIPPMAHKILIENNIKLYFSNNDNVQLSLRDLANGLLPELPQQSYADTSGCAPGCHVCSGSTCKP